MDFILTLFFYFYVQAALTNVVWSGTVVDTSEFKVDDASDSTFGYFTPRDEFEVTLEILLMNLNSMQGIVGSLSSPRVFDGEMLQWNFRNKKNINIIFSKTFIINFYAWMLSLATFHFKDFEIAN